MYYPIPLHAHIGQSECSIAGSSCSHSYQRRWEFCLSLPPIKGCTFVGGGWVWSSHVTSFLLGQSKWEFSFHLSQIGEGGGVLWYMLTCDEKLFSCKGLCFVPWWVSQVRMYIYTVISYLPFTYFYFTTWLRHGKAWDGLWDVPKQVSVSCRSLKIRGQNMLTWWSFATYYNIHLIFSALSYWSVVLKLESCPSPYPPSPWR